MRVKQTARKSTANAPTTPSGSRARTPSVMEFAVPAATPVSARSARNRRTRVLNDPVKLKLSNLLQTKRKSATPLAQRTPPGQSSGGKRIYVNDEGASMVKTKPRNKPGEWALKEIRKLQNGFDNLIPRSAFHRIVRELTQKITSEGNQNNGPSDMRYQTAALEALQDATESYLVHLFEDSYLCCLHAKRVTLFIQDMQLCQRLQQHRGLHHH